MEHEKIFEEIDLPLGYLQLLDKEEYTEEDMKALEKYQDDLINKTEYISNCLYSMQNQAFLLEEKYRKLLNNIQTLKNYLLSVFDTCKLDNVKTLNHTIKLKYGQPKVHIYDTTKIPDEFTREKVSKTPDITKIKHQLYNNIEVPGCKLYQEKDIQIIDHKE